MVKKAAQAIPNHLLRHARLERGWTQKVVAERIGAPNDMMITCWERGTTFPSSYYVERLCQLFDQRASDLGLLREPHPMASSQQLSSRQRRPSSLEYRTSKQVSLTPMTQGNVSAAPLSRLPLIGREADSRALRDLYGAVQQGQCHPGAGDLL